MRLPIYLSSILICHSYVDIYGGRCKGGIEHEKLSMRSDVARACESPFAIRPYFQKVTCPAARQRAH